MVSVAQLVESRIVIPVVVGSSPIVHPNKFPQISHPPFSSGKVLSELSFVSQREILQENLSEHRAMSCEMV